MTTMTNEEAEDWIRQILKENGRMTTEEIQKYNMGQGVNCPDGVVKTLTKLRYKGKIKGELSREAGGWVWWVEDSDNN